MTGSGMRRDERELRSFDEIDAIIRRATICRVGFVDGDEPYVVPLNFGWERARRRFWFHSATEGRKPRLLAAAPRVAVEMDEDLGLVTHPEKACAWTQGYRSVMAWGPARVARDRDEARHGLDILMRHHGGEREWHYPDAMLDHTLVWCVEVDRITAKEHWAKVDDA